MSTTIYCCDNCDWKGTVDDMAPIDDIAERVHPGELHPAGQCPLCRALIEVADADVDEHTLRHCVDIHRRRAIEHAIKQLADSAMLSTDDKMFGCAREHLNDQFSSIRFPDLSPAFIVFSMLSDAQEMIAFGLVGELPPHLERARQILNVAKHGLQQYVIQPEREGRE